MDNEKRNELKNKRKEHADVNADVANYIGKLLTVSTDGGITVVHESSAEAEGAANGSENMDELKDVVVTTSETGYVPVGNYQIYVSVT